MCVCYGSTIATQFRHFRVGRSKRLFALSVRFWTMGCFRLFIAAYFCNAVALAFLGDTYFPTTCGSAQATANALAAANVSSVDDEGSPCEPFFGAELTRAGGIVIATGILITVAATNLRLQRCLTRLVCCGLCCKQQPQWRRR